MMIETGEVVPETLAAALVGSVACTQTVELLLPEMLPEADAVVVSGALASCVLGQLPKAIRICHADAAESRAVRVEPAVPVLASVNCWPTTSPGSMVAQAVVGIVAVEPVAPVPY